MTRRIKDAKVTAGYPISSSSGSGEEWKHFQFHIHDFANLSTTRNHYIAVPEFTCNGHQWELKIYPGGFHQAPIGKVSFYLHHVSEGEIKTSFDVKLIDKFGKVKVISSTKHEFTADSKTWGWHNFANRSGILHESQNILDDNGTLTVVVSMEEKGEPKAAFVPNNPFVNMMQGMINDENTADICFEVGNSSEGKRVTRNTKRVKTTTSFYAHRFIIENCAPMLAAICGSNDSGGVVTASVNDIKPEIFRHLLSYVYGGSVPEEELKTYAKGIIAAADKYSIVNLKLEAEAAYVQSADISLDNSMDHLLYADSMNLALLKEAVMNFLAANPYEAAERLSFTECPEVMKDLLIAVGRNKDANGTNVDELTTLSVSALRRKLHEMGLEVDGSREAMIESIKKSL